MRQVRGEIYGLIAGYYRVNYDEDNWKRLTSQLLEDHTVFAESTRAMLVDDVMALSAQFLPTDVDLENALDLMQYLAKERAYAPWVAAAKHIDQMAVHIRVPNRIWISGEAFFNVSC